jgi:thioredoxin reductase (NADPH)
MQEVIIIGSGPAGLTAAIYAARAKLDPLVIEGLDAGGQLMLTTMVENWPGYRDGIMGPDLIAELRLQATRFGSQIITGNVDNVDISSSSIKVQLGETLYESRSLIISTGASARLLGLPAELKLMGHGVSTCATCDGFFFKERPIVVVGGGDSAMEEAIFLTKFASHVTVVHRRNVLRASKIMQDKALNHPKISFEWNTELSEIKDREAGKVTSVILRHVDSGLLKELSVDGVFVAIGHNPNTSLFAGQLDLDKQNYIKTKNGSLTSRPGVFACGDVQDPVYRQAVTAAGSGCMAAIDAERYLEALPTPGNAKAG